MILTTDAIISLVLCLAILSTFNIVKNDFDFSSKEIIALKHLDEISIALQAQRSALIELKNGNAGEMRELFVNLQENCFEVETSEQKYGECEGNKITRNFYIFDTEPIEVQVSIYFN